MLPANYNISSVQPTLAASEGTSVFGPQRDDREEPHTYQGVQKVTDKPIYIGQVRENDGTKSGRKIYLGKFDKEVNAARAQDLVALKLWGSSAKTNFPESQYKRALEAMTDMKQMEVVETVRRLSFSFSKSISMYRGVTRDSCTLKWEASFGIDSDYRFLGIFDTEEEAARAHDVESIRSKGHNAITNFSTKFYNVEAILHGETDYEKVIYQTKDAISMEAMQPSEVLQNIISQGTSTMLYGTCNSVNNGEGEQNFQRPISGNTEEQANVALADGQGNSAWCF